MCRRQHDAVRDRASGDGLNGSHAGPGLLPDEPESATTTGARVPLPEIERDVPEEERDHGQLRDHLEIEHQNVVLEPGISVRTRLHEWPEQIGIVVITGPLTEHGKEIPDDVRAVPPAEREPVSEAVPVIRNDHDTDDDRNGKDQGVSDHATARNDTEGPGERLVDEIGEDAGEQRNDEHAACREPPESKQAIDNHRKNRNEEVISRSH